MNDYLSQHPEVFVPGIKEVHFFGSDLHFTKGALRDEGAYRALFAGATEPRRGEASVWYLYSRTAAKEIHAFSPDAKVIVMLRNPADMLYSQHSQFLYNGNEDITDFREALAAEPERRAGRRIPASAHLVEGLFYSETVKYAEQLERYFDIFGSWERPRYLIRRLSRRPAGDVPKDATVSGCSGRLHPRVRGRQPQQTCPQQGFTQLCAVAAGEYQTPQPGVFPAELAPAGDEGA